MNAIATTRLLLIGTALFATSLALPVNDLVKGALPTTNACANHLQRTKIDHPLGGVYGADKCDPAENCLDAVDGASHCKDQTGDCLKAAEAFCSRTSRVPKGGILRAQVESGLDNQRESLLNAAVAALLQNATLVTPTVFLVAHAKQEPKPHDYDEPWSRYAKDADPSARAGADLANAHVPFGALFDPKVWHSTLASYGLHVDDGTVAHKNNGKKKASLTMTTSYQFSTCFRYYDCCARLPYCLDMQRSLLRPSRPIALKVKEIQASVRKRSGCYIGVHSRFWHNCNGVDIDMAWKADIQDAALLAKRQKLARAMAAGPIKLILENKLNEKCNVVYLITEVTWPELHQEYAKHGLEVFWKQQVEPDIQKRWPFEALAYVDWMMAVESDYFLMFEKGISSFDSFALMQRRFASAPTFEYTRGHNVECGHGEE